MSDYSLFFEDLSPNEALRLLAETVESGATTILSSLLIEVNRSAFGLTVTLTVPETAPTQKNLVQARDYAQAVIALTRQHQAMKALEPRRMAAREGGLPASKGLAWLLLHSENSAPAQQVREFLLVAHNTSTARAAAAFEDLRFHATSLRLAAAGEEPDQRYFFHVLDDPNRHSSLASLLAGEAFEDFSLLFCRQVDAYRIFLPPEADPDQAALQHFCRVLSLAPELLDMAGPLASQGPFVAIDPGRRGASVDETTRTLYDILYLGQLHFHGNADFSPPPAKSMSFSIPRLEASVEALSKLRRAIAGVEPKVGYRLALRPTRHREPIEMERVRLYERQAEIDYKIAYLDSISRSKPHLLRFSQQQLPALAALVHAIPQQVLRRGFPRYAFQALHHDPAGGYHYLLIDPREVVLSDLDPIPAWQEASAPAMRFWLDPFWARHYQRGNQCLVFVPEGHALFPSLHGWEAESMDRYMRDLIENWFADTPADLPQVPLYLFDSSRPTDGRREVEDLRLVVLDAGAFGPLNLQIGWINDHLVIADAVDLTPFIEKMADAATISGLADQVTRQAAAKEAEFDRLLLETNQRISQKLNELTTIVSRELNKVVSETHHTTERIKEVFAYLHQLDAIREEARTTSEEAYNLLRQTEGTNKELKRFLEQLNRDVEREIQNAYLLRRGIIGKVTATIRELSTTHEELRNKLFEILRRRRK